MRGPTTINSNSVNGDLHPFHRTQRNNAIATNDHDLVLDHALAVHRHDGHINKIRSLEAQQAQLMRFQQLVAQLAVERLDVAVVCGLTRPGEIELDAPVICPVLERQARKLGAMVPGDRYRLPMPAAVDRRRAAEVATEIDAAVVRYLVATALINIGQAAAVGLAMWLLGMPNPLLWGMLTFAFEFVPYLGGAVMVGLLTIVAFTTFDSAGHILAAPGAYLAITTLQNNLVSPLVYGNRLRLNPVAVLIGVLFWWSLWGVSGAFLAVPVIAAAKILGDHVPRLRAMGEFPGD